MSREFCEGEETRAFHRRPEYRVVIEETQGSRTVARTKILCHACTVARLWARARGRDQVDLTITLLNPADPANTTVLHEPSRS